MNIHDPRTLNQYQYAIQSPLSFIDPSGLDTILILYGGANNAWGVVPLKASADALKEQEEALIGQAGRQGTDQVIEQQAISPEAIQQATSRRYESGLISKLILVMHGNEREVAAFTYEADTPTDDSVTPVPKEPHRGMPAWAAMDAKRLGSTITRSNFTEGAILELLSCNTANVGPESIAAKVAGLTQLLTIGVKGHINYAFSGQPKVATDGSITVTPKLPILSRGAEYVPFAATPR